MAKYKSNFIKPGSACLCGARRQAEPQNPNSNYTRMVRLPMNRVGAIHKVGKVLEKLQRQHGREPSLHEVADCLEMTDY